MAEWTGTDLARIDAAIASGVKEVRLANGRTVVYQSIDDLRKARTEILTYLGSQSSPPVRQLRVFTDKGWGN
jgi:hypothetical protein